MIKVKISILLSASFLLLNTAFAMEAERITPENSTRIHYKVAKDALEKCLADLLLLPENEEIPGDFSHQHLTRREYEGSMKFSYLNNILVHGCHPGIPEGTWDYRGWVKAGNQRLIRTMTALYQEQYDLGENIAIKQAGDPIQDPYIIFSEGYAPHRPEEMTVDETSYVATLRREFEEANPSVTNSLPTKLNYALAPVMSWLKSFG